MTIPAPPAEPPRSAAPPPVAPALEALRAPQWPGHPEKSPGSKKHLFFGAGGLAIGLITGLLTGLLLANVGSSMENTAAAGSMASPTSNARPISAAILKCELQNSGGVTVMDGGKSLDIKTAGTETTGIEIADLMCVLVDLKTPQSVIARMESTRALDGTLEGAWAEYTASWTFHPDRGLDVVIETTAK